MAKYMLDRYHQRRSDAIKQLGGKCSKCGQMNDLEFDHIDPNSKSFVISRLNNVSKSKLQQELNKCQLLCKQCHIEKTLVDKGQKSARLTHGTLSSYRYCKCDLCRKANADYCKLKRSRKKD
ncbi:MAG: HNH endonuclease [Proteobacteria bacterium]|nr:MAG: HNH endonuclease [Pseudomonadota bacterium]